MGTAQLAFEVVMWGSATGSDRVRMRNLRWRHWPWPEVTSPVVMGSMFCACATGSCAISVLVGPFDRKWQSHVTERALTGSMFCAFPAFSRVFFLSSSNMATLGSCATPIMTEGHVIPSEVFSTTSASYNHRKTPRPIFIMVTGSIPGYLPLLFSHSVYIGCVVLLLC